MLLYIIKSTLKSGSICDINMQPLIVDSDINIFHLRAKRGDRWQIQSSHVYAMYLCLATPPLSPVFIFCALSVFCQSEHHWLWQLSKSQWISESNLGSLVGALESVLGLGTLSDSVEEMGWAPELILGMQAWR